MNSAGMPSASKIRSAKAKAVGGGRKRCRKGKNCSATCIAGNKDCLVDLPEPAADATRKVAAMLSSKNSSNISAQTQPAAPVTPAIAENSTLQILSKMINEAREDYEKAYGTPGQAEAKARFDNVVAMYERAKTGLQKEAEGPPPSAARSTNTYNLDKKQIERVESNADTMNRRIEGRINERQFYDDATNARVRAQNEAIVKPFQSMTNDEKAALNLYGENVFKFYKDTNELLRSGKIENSTPEKENMARFIEGNLTSGLKKLPAEQGTTLERAVTGNFATALGNLKVGDIIQDKGFGSYTDNGTPTLNQFFSKTEPNAAIKFESKTARKVAPVMEYSREGEHITLPGTKFRLVDIQKEGVYSRKTGGYIPQYTFEEVIE